MSTSIFDQVRTVQLVQAIAEGRHHQYDAPYRDQDIEAFRVELIRRCPVKGRGEWRVESVDCHATGDGWNAVFRLGDVRRSDEWIDFTIYFPSSDLA